MPSIERHSPAPQFAVCATAVGNSTEIPMAGAAGGLILFPASLGGAASLTFYVAGGPTGRAATATLNAGDAAYAPTYKQLYDDSNAAITRTPTAAKAIRIPLEAFAAGNLKIVSDVAITVEVLLKG